MKKITSHPIAKSGHNIVLAIAALLFVAVLFYAAFFAGGAEKAKAGNQHNISGWAWSGNPDSNNDGVVDGDDNNEIGGIGWISLNCTNTSSCATVDYGVDAAADGDLSGYAWYGWEDSEEDSTIGGWISFNESDLSGCPSGSCKAKISGNSLQGWARALSYNYDDYNEDDENWDGWISLDGASYGVVKDGNDFKEFAWDASTIGGKQIGIGWIEFDPSFGGITLSSGNAPTVDISANPTLVFSGSNSTLTWTSTNAASCDASVGWSGSKALSDNEVVGPISSDTVYWLTCTNELSSTSDSVTVFIDTSTQCADGIDNDGDGQTDYPEDTSCSGLDGDDESIPVCGNTVCESGENPGNCTSDCGTVQFEEF